MKRAIYKKLLLWKQSQDKSPLIVKGARQVGKTFIIKGFGENEFPNCHVFNFEKDKQLAVIFEENLDPNRIVRELSLYSGKVIDTQHDFVFFDEIQECPKALTSLKYFCEDLPYLHLCCAGSLIGISLASESFPVGKVDFLTMYPMTFLEFLDALGDAMSLEIMNDLQSSKKQSQMAHKRLWNQLKIYYFTGGMPKVIDVYRQSYEDNISKAILKTRSTQQSLIESYFKDFAKHSGKINVMHIASVLEDVPMQLSKNMDGSVKRFRFKGVIPGKKSYTDLQGPIDWLEKAGLLIKVKICNRAEIPLESFCKNNIFKLYLFDIGLLGSLLDLPENRLLLQDFGIARGYFAENFVAQELWASGLSKLHGWQSRNSEIEFILQMNDRILPVEVKSGKRTQAKSLQQYIMRYSPEIAIKLSGNSLYAIHFL
jgi:hypothetical protein